MEIVVRRQEQAVVPDRCYRDLTVNGRGRYSLGRALPVQLRCLDVAGPVKFNYVERSEKVSDPVKLVIWPEGLQDFLKDGAGQCDVLGLL
ncbi:MAG: hypothetical protein WBW88_17020 [Rhodothermales bacterium]